VSLSWTRNETTALKFAENSVTRNAGNKWAVVVAAQVETNLEYLLSANGLYSLRFAEDFANENEIISLGPVTIDTISWYS
jgi:hypothetical protein